MIVADTEGGMGGADDTDERDGDCHGVNSTHNIQINIVPSVMMMNGVTHESQSDTFLHNNVVETKEEEKTKTTHVSNLVQQLDFLSSPLDNNADATLPADNVPSDVPADTAVVDETPYEHDFAPGDHIIRWDMLPILWPIQIHGIVLEVSEDKSEVIICDFGMTSVKGSEDEDKKPVESQSIKKLEEDNAIFTNAIHSEPLYVSNAEQLMMLDGTNTTTAEQSMKKNKKKANKHQRLNVITLRKWSDLRKWSKVDYAGGLFSGKAGGGIGKGLETLGKQTEKGLAASKEGLENLGKQTGKGLERLGKQTEKLWLSMKPLFAGDAGEKKGGGTKAYRTIRNEVDDMGRCLYHNEIQIKERTDDGSWVAIRKKCPECIKEDCPVMLGDDTYTAETPLLDQVSNSSSSEGEHSHITVVEVSRAKIEGTSIEAPSHPVKLKALSTSNNTENEAKIFTFDDTITSGGVAEEVDTSKSLSQMIEEANEVERQCRLSHQSPDRKPTAVKQKSYYGSFMNSLKDIGNFTKSSTKLPSTVSTGGEVKHEATNSTNGAKATPTKAIPRCDPPLLVLARTRFILEHGESILPPYHILNANSECIAVWCKTGRWSTFQASVYLHSSAIGYGKSTIGLSLAAAATQPWLIPAFATMGVAAIGTPWVLLKIANEKWNEATNDLTEKFWAQAENEVIVECIRKWSSTEDCE